MADALGHGTLRTGERHPNAKLLDEEVDEIREKLAAGESQKSIMLVYGISQPQVSMIENNKSRRKKSRSAV